MAEPNLEDYRLPGKDEELNEMIEKMMDCGMSNKSAEVEIKKRKKQYKAAVKKYVTTSKSILIWGLTIKNLLNWTEHVIVDI